MPDQQQMVESLTSLGMSAYEAKAYLALLAAGEPLNGYEVAKRSGVPRGTVYETLGKLTTRGAAFEVRAGEDSVDYLPLPASTYLARLRREFSATVGGLEQSLARVSHPARHVVHQLQSTSTVIDRARDLIGQSRREILSLVFPEELPYIRDDLAEADKRGVDVTTVLMGNDDVDVGVGRLHQHRFRPAAKIEERVGGRLLILVGDVDAALISASTPGGMSGMFTNDWAVVLVALELIRHDVALQILAERHGWAQMSEMLASDPDLSRLATGRLPRPDPS